MTPAEQSHEVWLSQARVGEGGKGGGQDVSVDVATTKLRLDDETSSGDEESGIERDVDSQDGRSQVRRHLQYTALSFSIPVPF